MRPAKHPVVIAFDHCPVTPGCDFTDQQINHLAAVGTTVGQIPDEHHGSIPATVVFNLGQRVLQQVKLTVDIAKRIKGLRHNWFPYLGAGEGMRGGWLAGQRSCADPCWPLWSILGKFYLWPHYVSGSNNVKF